MLNLDIGDVIAEVRSIAGSMPDYVYPSSSYTSPPCVYAPDESRGLPSCIVGRALIRNGVPVSALAYHEGFTAADTIHDLSGAEGDIPDLPEWRWINTVQRRQDVGVSWREAVGFADLQYPLGEL